MTKRISIGSWGLTNWADRGHSVPLHVGGGKLKGVGLDWLGLGAFPPHPNPGNPAGADADWPGAMPEKSQRLELAAQMRERGLGFSGIAANLWGEKLINTDDQ